MNQSTIWWCCLHLNWTDAHYAIPSQCAEWNRRHKKILLLIVILIFFFHFLPLLQHDRRIVLCRSCGDDGRGFILSFLFSIEKNIKRDFGFISISFNSILSPQERHIQTQTPSEIYEKRGTWMFGLSEMAVGADDEAHWTLREHVMGSSVDAILYTTL